MPSRDKAYKSHRRRWLSSHPPMTRRNYTSGLKASEKYFEAHGGLYNPKTVLETPWVPFVRMTLDAVAKGEIKTRTAIQWLKTPRLLLERAGNTTAVAYLKLSEPKKPDEEVDKAIDPATVGELLDRLAKSKKYHGSPEELMFHVLFLSAPRFSDLMHLEAEDINLARNTITYNHPTKSSFKLRGLHPQLKDALEGRCQVRDLKPVRGGLPYYWAHPTGPLFSHLAQRTWSGRLKKAIKHVGMEGKIPGFYPHQARHTYIDAMSDVDISDRWIRAIDGRKPGGGSIENYRNPRDPRKVHDIIKAKARILYPRAGFEMPVAHSDEFNDYDILGRTVPPHRDTKHQAPGLKYPSHNKDCSPSDPLAGSPLVPDLGNLPDNVLFDLLVSVSAELRGRAVPEPRGELDAHVDSAEVSECS